MDICIIAASAGFLSGAAILKWSTGAVFIAYQVGRRVGEIRGRAHAGKTSAW